MSSDEALRTVWLSDNELRALVGTRFGNIEIAGQYVHTTRTGKRLLVLHSDEFDKS